MINMGKKNYWYEVILVFFFFFNFSFRFQQLKNVTFLSLLVEFWILDIVSYGVVWVQRYLHSQNLKVILVEKSRLSKKNKWIINRKLQFMKRKSKYNKANYIFKKKFNNK